MKKLITQFLLCFVLLHSCVVLCQPKPPSPSTTRASTSTTKASTTTTTKLITSTTTTTTTSTTTSSSSLEKIITSWKKSTGKGYGNYQADVTGIYYDSTYVYVSTNMIPSYSIGNWTANPNLPTPQNKTVKFLRKASSSTTKSAVSLGTIGLWINGVGIYNADDGQSYNNTGIWKRNAFFWEGISFDSCLGHPAPGGVYHNHVNLNCYYNTTDSSKHSPLIGFLFDSYPIYGPFGYSSANDSSSSIKRMTSGYKLRNITARTSTPTNSVLSSTQYGPAISTTYPLGAFLQDYDYYGTGDLDKYNGRWCVTPEFPSGTYAYFVTTDSTGNPAFPFTISPYFYYGTILSGQASSSVPSTATTYFKV